MHFNSFHIRWRKNIRTLHNLHITHTHTSFRSEPVAWLPASAFGLSRFEMAVACMAKSELWNTPLTPQLSYWCNILRMLLHHTMNVATLSVRCLESACWSSMMRWYQGRPRWGADLHSWQLSTHWGVLQHCSRFTLHLAGTIHGCNCCNKIMTRTLRTSK